MRRQLFTENFIGLYVWLALIAGSLLLYLLNPELFTPANIRRFFSANLAAGLAIYLLLSVARGFLLIPLTPLLLAGILVFPAWPLFWVTLAGIALSSALVYLLARQLRLDRFFRRHYAARLDHLTSLLAKGDLPVIVLWSFIPFTPTDLIVYVCSVLGISLWRTLAGVVIGEALICALYIFGGEAGLALLSGASA